MSGRHDLKIKIELKGLTDEEYDFLKNFLENNKPVEGRIVTFGETALATILEFKQCIFLQYKFDELGTPLGHRVFQHSIDVFVNDP